VDNRGFQYFNKNINTSGEKIWQGVSKSVNRKVDIDNILYDLGITTTAHETTEPVGFVIAEPP
jgi:hypothetical protein